MFNKPASTENKPSIAPPSVTTQPTVSEPAISTSPPPQQSSKKLLMIVSAVILVLVAAFGAFAMMQQPTDIQPDPQPTTAPTTTPAPTEEATFCTMDAKICPDGSSVGRVPPSCEFEACPGEENTTNNMTRFTNQELGFELSVPEEWPELTMSTATDSAVFSMPLQNQVGNYDRHHIFSINRREKFDLGPGPFYEQLLTETPQGVYVFRGTHEGVSTGPDDTSVDAVNFEKFPENPELFQVIKNNFKLL